MPRRRNKPKAPSTPSISPNPTPSAIPFPTPSLEERINQNKKWKARSQDYHNNKHRPEIARRLAALSANPTDPNAQINVVLLGSSMLERFKTTARNSQLSLRRDVLNLGVGGDKIESVIYRLSLGLLPLLRPFAPKLYVIHIGTNNLRSNRGPLRPFEVDNLRLILEAILASDPGTKILLCEIFRRQDIGDWQVKESNELYEEVVCKVNEEEGRERVWVQAMPESIDVGRHLVDHVHLNFEGYRIWEGVLRKRIETLLGE